jgi:ATPase-IB1_Cu: copper-translocating P-type ATPase
MVGDGINDSAPLPKPT